MAIDARDQCVAAAGWRSRVATTTCRLARRRSCVERPGAVRRPVHRGKESEVADIDLYLMQHGQATTETENPERFLTDAG